MGLQYSSVVDAPRAGVFAWYARPGAFNRLSPPWSPLRVVTEANSLEDGCAELALPGGLRWVARHQPDSYDPPRRFVDAIGNRTAIRAGNEASPSLGGTSTNSKRSVSESCSTPLSCAHSSSPRYSP